MSGLVALDYEISIIAPIEHKIKEKFHENETAHYFNFNPLHKGAFCPFSFWW